MASSTYSDNLVLNYLLRGVSAPPSSWYVALFTSDPSVDSSTEVSGNGYTRQAVTFLAAIGGVVRNSADLTFGTATSSWGVLTHYAVYDASTSGNLLVYGVLESSYEVETDDQVIIQAGKIQVSLE